MKIEELKENNHIEFKLMESGKIPNSLFQTYSAFANTEGGDIYIGIEERNHKVYKIIGVSNIDKFKIDLFNCLNNKQKVSKNILNDNDITIINYKGFNVVKIHIGELDRREKPIYLNNNPFECFKRNNEGDYRVSLEESLSMLSDSSKEAFDQKINACNLSFEDINKTTFSSFRNVFNMSNPSNLFMSLSDKDFANKIGILKKDKNGKYFLTNAAVLLFCDYNKIISIYPKYFIDYQENISNASRWDYRLVSDDMSWSGNLFDYFIIVLGRLKQFISEKFTIKDMVDSSLNLMYEAIREALVNSLCNADFLSDNPILIKKKLYKIEFRNSGRPLVGIEQMKRGGETNPRNKELIRFFRLIKYCERSGNGVPTILASFKKMQYIEPSIWEMSSPDYTIFDMRFDKLVDGNSKVSYNEIFNFIDLKKQGVSQSELINYFQVDSKTIRKYLEILISRGLIETNNKKTKGKLYFSKN